MTPRPAKTPAPTAFSCLGSLHGEAEEGGHLWTEHYSAARGGLPLTDEMIRPQFHIPWEEVPERIQALVRYVLPEVDDKELRLNSINDHPLNPV